MSDTRWQIFEYLHQVREVLGRPFFLELKLTNYSEPLIISSGKCTACERECSVVGDQKEAEILKRKNVSLVYCTYGLKDEEKNRFRVAGNILLDLIVLSMEVVTTEEREKIRKILESVKVLIRKVGNLGELLIEAIEIIASVLDVGRVSIMLYDEKEDVLKIYAARGLPADVVRKVRVKLGEGISGKVAASGRSLFVVDIEKDPRFSSGNKPYYQTRSFVSVPLIGESKVVGVVNVSEKRGDGLLTRVDLEVVEFLSNIVATLIDRTFLHAELRHKQEKLSEMLKLYEDMYDLLSKMLSITNTIFMFLSKPVEDLMKKIAEILLTSFGLDVMVVALGQDFKNRMFVSNEELKPIFARTLTPEFLKKISFISEVVVINCSSKGYEFNPVINSLIFESTMEALVNETGYKSWMVVPLIYQGEKYGFIFMARNNKFEVKDKEFGESLTKQLTIALYNFKLQEESVKVQVFQRELELGRKIQQSMFPVDYIEGEYLNNYAVNIPAKVVGGDYYDWFEDRNGDHVFMVADVSGKGISSALMVSEIRALLHAYRKSVDSLSGVVKFLNEYFVEFRDKMKRNLFFTAFLSKIIRNENKLRFVRAGHNPAIVVYRDGSVKVLDTPGMLVGTFGGIDWPEDDVSLDGITKLVMYTDGITEAFDVNGKEYGLDNLIRVLEKVVEEDAEESVDRVMYDVKQFTAGAEQSDDITVLIVDFKRKVLKERVIQTDEVKIAQLIEEIAEDARKNGVTGKEFDYFILVMDELLANAAEHGNAFNPEKSIYVKWLATENKFEFMVKDDGLGLNPEKLHNLTISPMASRGRGLYIVDNLVNKFYVASDGYVKAVRYFWLPSGIKIYRPQ